MKPFRLLLFCLAIALTTHVSAQREIQGQRWWYGSHINLGFSGSTFQSVFSIGLEPMVGYKLMPFLSVGPRAKMIYTNVRIKDFAGNVEGTGVFDYGLGAFIRPSIYRGFFAQGEIGYENNGQVFLSNQLEVRRIDGINAYIGAGYNSSSGGNLAYEVMLAYDLNLLRINTLDLLNYRIGFTLYY